MDTGSVQFPRLYQFLPLAEDAGEGCEDNNAGDDTGHQVGNALGQIHPLEAQAVGEEKVGRTSSQ